MLPGKATLLNSKKYHIAVPWLYSATAGFGVFFNQPGSGKVGLDEGGIAFNFTCQKQLDMWHVQQKKINLLTQNVLEDTNVVLSGRWLCYLLFNTDVRSILILVLLAFKRVGTFPAGSAAAAANPAPSVYEAFASATGKPAMLPEYAAEYWQSKDAYHNQSEIIQLARNFSDRNLTVGVIVIDLGVPTAPVGTHYYQLDPARFPNVPAMSAAVTKLTGAYLMPNLKPTSVVRRKLINVVDLPF